MFWGACPLVESGEGSSVVWCCLTTNLQGFPEAHFVANKDSSSAFQSEKHALAAIYEFTLGLANEYKVNDRLPLVERASTLLVDCREEKLNLQTDPILRICLFAHLLRMIDFDLRSFFLQWISSCWRMIQPLVYLNSSDG